MPVDIGELRGLLTLTDQFSKPVDDAAKGVGAFTESFGAITGAVGLAAGAITAAGAAIVALGQHGAGVSDVRDAFADLSRATGESAASMLGELQKGTLGTIANFDLMKQANKALGSGLITSSRDMGTLAAGAKLLADRTGGETSAAFDTLTEAMAKGRTSALKQLGVFVDSKVAVEDYAKSIGKSTGDLTDSERAAALSGAALKALRAELEAAGPATADFGDLIDQAKTAFGNFTDSMAVAIAESPVLRAGLEAVSTAVTKAFGGDQTNLIRTLMGYVNDFAITLTQVADIAIEAARLITMTWDGLKITFNAVLGFIAEGVASVVGYFAGLIEIAQGIPGIGSKFDGVLQSIYGVEQQIAAVKESFAAQTAEAVDNAIAHQAAFDSMHTAVNDVRTAMVQAGEATVSYADASLSAEEGTRKVRDQVRELSEKELKALEEAFYAAMYAMNDTRILMYEGFAKLQEDLTILNATGLQQRLLEIEAAQAKELAGYQTLAFEVPEQYAKMEAGIAEKYRLISASAAQSFAEQTASGVDFHLTAIQQEQKTLAEVKKRHAETLASQYSTDADRAKSAAALAQAEKNLETTKKDHAIATMSGVASQVSGFLRENFGKNKAAAIAATAIDAAAAIVKAFAQGGILGFVSAGLIAATTAFQIAKIKSQGQEGFAEGTPGTAFQDFGRGSLEVLHGKEAVVTQEQGESLAGMVGAAIREARGATPAGGAPIQVQVFIGARRLYDGFFEDSQRGLLRISTDALVGERA